MSWSDWPDEGSYSHIRVYLRAIRGYSVVLLSNLQHSLSRKIPSNDRAAIPPARLLLIVERILAN